MRDELQGNTILIVGGTGSLGNALTERLLSKDFDVKKIIIFSRDEFKQHEMRLKFLNKKICTDEVIYANFSRKVEFQIGDIRDYHSIVRALKNVDVVFNTAAIKQVPVAEYYPMEAIKTNIIGTNNIITAISEFNLPIHTFVGISTDKACMPINAYGMTKSLMERLVIAANINIPSTRFVLTRYGNVMASRGSVIPLFADQIRNGQDVTITDPNMTRFMMNLPQAVNTIIDTYRGANPGEIYIPRISSAKVIDVADAMIGDREIRTRTVGIRPGEKLHEQLISNAEIRKSYHRDGYYVITPALPELWRDISVPPDGFVYSINDIEEYSSKDNIMTPKEVQVLLEREGLIP